MTENTNPQDCRYDEATGTFYCYTHGFVHQPQPEAGSPVPGTSGWVYSGVSTPEEQYERGLITEEERDALRTPPEMTSLMTIASRYNGATGNTASAVKGNDRDGWVVLAAVGYASAQPIVTHRVDMNGNAYLGHYFDDEGVAIRDYENR